MATVFNLIVALCLLVAVTSAAPTADLVHDLEAGVNQLFDKDGTEVGVFPSGAAEVETPSLVAKVSTLMTQASSSMFPPPAVGSKPEDTIAQSIQTLFHALSLGVDVSSEDEGPARSVLVASFEKAELQPNVLTELIELRRSELFWNQTEAYVDVVCGLLKRFIVKQRGDALATTTTVPTTSSETTVAPVAEPERLSIHGGSEPIEVDETSDVVTELPVVTSELDKQPIEESADVTTTPASEAVDITVAPTPTTEAAGDEATMPPKRPMTAQKVIPKIAKPPGGGPRGTAFPEAEISTPSESAAVKFSEPLNVQVTPISANASPVANVGLHRTTIRIIKPLGASSRFPIRKTPVNEPAPFTLSPSPSPVPLRPMKATTVPRMGHPTFSEITPHVKPKDSMLEYAVDLPTAAADAGPKIEPTPAVTKPKMAQSASAPEASPAMLRENGMVAPDQPEPKAEAHTPAPKAPVVPEVTSAPEHVSPNEPSELVEVHTMKPAKKPPTARPVLDSSEEAASPMSEGPTTPAPSGLGEVARSDLGASQEAFSIALQLDPTVTACVDVANATVTLDQVQPTPILMTPPIEASEGPATVPPEESPKPQTSPPVEFERPIMAPLPAAPGPVVIPPVEVKSSVISAAEPSVFFGVPVGSVAVSSPLAPSVVVQFTGGTLMPVDRTQDAFSVPSFAPTASTDTLQFQPTTVSLGPQSLNTSVGTVVVVQPSGTVNGISLSATGPSFTPVEHSIQPTPTVLTVQTTSRGPIVIRKLTTSVPQVRATELTNRTMHL